MSLRLLLTAFTAMLLAAGPVAAQDAALNKEGFWTVGRDTEKSPSCAASLVTKAGPLLVLEAMAGGVSLVVESQAPIKPGKQGVVTMDAASFGFSPIVNDQGDRLFAGSALDERMQAALKLTEGVSVDVDGERVLGADLRGTGTAGALDAVIACSEGKAGWWGPGVAAQPVVATEENDPGTERPRHKDGVWTLAADGARCTAAAPIKPSGGLVILATNAGRDVLVGVSAERAFEPGGRGRFETDDYRFDFKPTYSGERYLQFDQFLDSEGFLALRRAAWLSLSIDGREVVKFDLVGSGFPDVFAALQACARGEAGWWGDGAVVP